MITNPFPSVAYYSPEFFCDREQETAQLLNNIKDGRSTSLIAIRRIGKTGLIYHALYQLPENYRGIYLDILDTDNLHQFLNKLTTAIIKALPEKSSVGKKFWDFLKSMRPTISYDPLTGAPLASFSIEQKEVEVNIDAILNYLENQKYRTVIAIDEFQQIISYPESSAEAWLRTRMQHLSNICFIFAGSQQHLMQELFTSPNRPFFRSTALMKLEKLNANVYAEFVVAMFEKYKKTITKETAKEIIEWCETHTYYVQQLCGLVFTATKKEATRDIWVTKANELLKEQEMVFFSFRNMLTKNQWKMLQAIATEGRVFRPTALSFLRKYELGTSASALRAIKKLYDSELLYKDYDTDGKEYYSVYDVYFKRWCMRK